MGNSGKSNHAEQAAARFDSWAETYGEDRISLWLEFYQSLVLSKLNFRGGFFLDVGCGVGYAVREATMRGAEKACGIDISPKMIEKAKALAQHLKNVEYQVANAEAIPYEDQSFNSVICTCSFHHYENPFVALNEIRRVSTDDGRFVLLDPARDVYFPIWLQDRVRRYLEKSHVRYYTTSEMKELLGEAGWRVCGEVQKIKRLMDHRKVFTGLMLVECEKA